jgi:4-amino-4-deoxy-L-arabinose transferase-like glycosyltransferase
MEIRDRHRDLIGLAILALLASLLMFSGLSIRSLWGSEGRWAEIAREMVLSNNYFLPAINGQVYFDKPLLSYWAIIPFSMKSGLTEAAARVPSALAGIGTVLLLYLLGRRLFGAKTGLIAAGLLTTMAMFLFWARTASAELLNLGAIWLVLWVFITGASRGRSGHIILLYSIGAAASFLKGPVAPAVAFTAIVFYSSLETILAWKAKGLAWTGLKEPFLTEFRWLVSYKGLLGIAVGLAVFGCLLLMPVVSTGSWHSLELMWRENVVRFLSPFDHVEPPYAYLKHVLLFCAPWSLCMLASLWQARDWEPGRPKRWVLMAALAIFLFFTLSGSRRSYYILPVVPALALLTGKGITRWLDGQEGPSAWYMELAATLTAALLTLAGFGILYVYAADTPYGHWSQLLLAPAVILGGGMSILFFLKKHNYRGFITLIALVFAMELWGFNIGMALAERQRLLRPFCTEVAIALKGVEDEKIALFREGSSSLIFYLNRGPLRNLNSGEDVRRFAEQHPDGFLIGDLNEIRALQEKEHRDRLAIVIFQKRSGPEDRGERFALLRFGAR